MRLFYALWPEASTRRELVACARLLGLRDGRPVAPTNLHLTLWFLGEVAAATASELRAASASVRTPVFDLNLVLAGGWPRSRVAWLAPREVPDGLTELVATVRRLVLAQGVALADSIFRPHVTVARQVRRPPALAAAFSLSW